MTKKAANTLSLFIGLLPMISFSMSKQSQSDKEIIKLAKILLNLKEVFSKKNNTNETNRSDNKIKKQQKQKKKKFICNFLVNKKCNIICGKTYVSQGNLDRHQQKKDHLGY